MMRIAVFHDSHTVGYDIASWMLHDLGYRVYVAGESFKEVIPDFRTARYPPGRDFLTRNGMRPPWDGVIELRDLSDDVLFVDTFPRTERSLRQFGWKGSILFYWILPVGRDFIAAGNFRPGRNVGVLAFNAAIAREIKRLELCPVEFLLPPYSDIVTFPIRGAFEPFLISAVNRVVDWTPPYVHLLLEQLRTNPSTRLELYGLPPLKWAVPLDHSPLVARMAKATALFHVKGTDTPGYAWMEAAFQGVPVIFRPAFLDNTEFKFLRDGDTCMVADSEGEIHRIMAQLGEPSENQRIGMALRDCLLGLCSWKTNRAVMERLLSAIKS